MKAFWCLLVMVNVSMRTTVIPCDAQCQELIKKDDGANSDILEVQVPVVENTKADASDKDSKDLATKSTTLQPYRNMTDNNRSLCDGARVTSVYERDRDIDIKYVLDSITALWRITFCLIFTLVLVVFLISYVSSLIRKSGEKKYSSAVKKHANRVDFPMDRSSQLYFPVINATRTANFLKDLDPIYDYPCSLQSEYEKV